MRINLPDKYQFVIIFLNVKQLMKNKKKKKKKNQKKWNKNFKNMKKNMANQLNINMKLMKWFLIEKNFYKIRRNRNM